MAHSYQMARGQRQADRDITEMAPMILESPEGDRVALGAAGSDKIPGAVLRAIVNIIDRRMLAQAAVADPACVIHEGAIQINTELNPTIGKRLAAIGLPLKPISPAAGEHFGLLHVACRARNAQLSGGADPYWDGGVAYA
jgi:gamma-glutamyltranspeptidase/glutathione hydrolase